MTCLIGSIQSHRLNLRLCFYLYYTRTSGDNKLEVEVHELIYYGSLKYITIAVRPGLLLLQQGDDRLVAPVLGDL